jgi:hypothetical protein
MRVSFHPKTLASPWASESASWAVAEEAVVAAAEVVLLTVFPRCRQTT